MTADAPAPRVLVAVVLDQESAGVHWRPLEAALREQRAELLWDVLVVDTTEHASENYADWLRAIRSSHYRPAGQRGRLRRLSDEDHGEIQAISDPKEQVRLGEDRAFECFCAWKSYRALWIVKIDDRPAPGELQRLWDENLLYTARVEAPVVEEFDLQDDPEPAIEAAKRVLSGATLTSL